MVVFSSFANGNTIEVSADDATNELTQVQFTVTNPTARAIFRDHQGWEWTSDAAESKTVAIPAGHNADDALVYFTRID